ncbi:MAG: SUMF1/EgtB/PvdO family nonheme iron enzyme [Acidobacteriota bacterium]
MAFIPAIVGDPNRYDLSDGGRFEDLWRDLAGGPVVEIPKLGRLRQPERRSFFGRTVEDPDEPQELQAYRGWALGRVDRLGLGFGDMLLDFGKVYVPLRLANTRQNLRRVKDEQGRIREVEEPEVTVVQVSNLLRDSSTRHAVVVGGAGSGKTTVLHQLHRTCLKDGPESLGLEPGTVPVFLRLASAVKADRKQPVPAADLKENADRFLRCFIEGDLTNASGLHLSEGIDAALHQHGRLLLLLDGLDEIADEELRLKAFHRILWALDTEDWRRVRAVFSCRQAGFTKSLRNLDSEDDDRRRWRLFEVQPLDDPEVDLFIDRWYRGAASLPRDYSGGDAEQAVLSLKGRLRECRNGSDRHLLSVASNPLLLTLLCQLVMSGGGVPENWVKFFGDCLDELLRRPRRRALGGQEPASYEALVLALESLAFLMHQQGRQEDLEDFEAFLAIKETLQVKPADAREVFQWLWQETGVLSRFNRVHYGFSHHRFQEFLVARLLARRPEYLEEIPDFLVHGPEQRSWWQYVFTFMVGLPKVNGFGSLSAFLIGKGVLEEGLGLFRECFSEALDPITLDPLVHAFETGDARRQHAILDLFAGRLGNEVAAALERLLASGTARSTTIRNRAAQLLKDCHRGPATSPRSAKKAFLAHASDAPRQVLDDLRNCLGDIGIVLSNPDRWPPWSESYSELETETGAILLPWGLGTVDPKAARLVRLYEWPTFVVRLPGEPGGLPDLPESWSTFERLEIDSLGASALRRALEPLSQVLWETRSTAEKDGPDGSLSARTSEAPPWNQDDTAPKSDRTLRGGEPGPGLSAPGDEPRTTRSGEFGPGPSSPEDPPRTTRSGGPSPTLSLEKSFSVPAGIDGGDPGDERFFERHTGELFLRVPAWRGRRPVGNGKRVMELEAFWLARTPVTNESYGLFLKESGWAPPTFWRHQELNRPRQPVVGMTWHGARKYCDWLTFEHAPPGLRFCLPSEDQWHYAASAGDDRSFPWGDRPPTERMADFDRPTAPGPADVGSFPEGAGAFGHLDLAGGVREWCRNFFDPAGLEPPDDGPYAVVRGSAWTDHASGLRLDNAAAAPVDGQNLYRGFRVACELEPVPAREPERRRLRSG